MAAASAIVAPTCYRIHCLLHRPSPPSSSFSLFLKPLLISTTTVSTTPFIPRRRIISPSLPSLPSRSLLFCHSSTLSHSPRAPKASLHEAEETQQLEIPEDDDDDKEAEIEIENLDNKKNAQVGLESSSGFKRDGVKPPSLTVKEKKELASYAHSLRKKLKSQLVGKSGVTASVAASFDFQLHLEKNVTKRMNFGVIPVGGHSYKNPIIENLESNELLKVKIHGTCPGELDDVVKQLEKATGSIIVGQIGRTVILYRPSLTKVKVEEKRQQMRKVFMRRKTYSRPTSVETFGHDSRGRTRV